MSSIQARVMVKDILEAKAPSGFGSDTLSDRKVIYGLQKDIVKVLMDLSKLEKKTTKSNRIFPSHLIKKYVEVHYDKPKNRFYLLFEFPVLDGDGHSDNDYADLTVYSSKHEKTFVLTMEKDPFRNNEASPWWRFAKNGKISLIGFRKCLIQYRSDWVEYFKR